MTWCMIGEHRFAQICQKPGKIQKRPLGGLQMLTTRADREKVAEVFWEFTQQSFIDEHIPALLSTNAE